VLGELPATRDNIATTCSCYTSWRVQRTFCLRWFYERNFRQWY